MPTPAPIPASSTANHPPAAAPVAVPGELAAPRLRDGLGVYALDGDRLQIGLANPVALAGLTPEEAAFVAQLEGPPGRAAVDATPFANVMHELHRRGLLATATDAPPRQARSTHVGVVGAAPLGADLALCLAEACVDRVTLDDTHVMTSPARAQSAVRMVNGRVPHVAHVANHGGEVFTTDVAVVIAQGGISLAMTHDLMSADQAHLPVITDERGVTVGPLILPGRGPCLTCLGIEQTESNADWPLIALQCNGARAPYAPAAVRALAVGVACDAVLRFLHGGGPDARQWRVECLAPGGRVDAQSPTSLRGGPRVTERVTTAHPACGCADALVLGDNLENLQSVLF